MVNYISLLLTIGHVSIKKHMMIVVLLYMAFSPCAQAATIHGTIYDWSDFETPLKNAIVEVNSTPLQYMVSNDGTYSFNISSGNYLIKCKYYQNNVLEYITEEKVEIVGDGVFVLDLLLFPPTDSEYEFLGDINLSEDAPIGEKYPNRGIHVSYYLLSFFILLLLAVWLFHLRKSRDAGDVVDVVDVMDAGDVVDAMDVVDKLQNDGMMPELGTAKVEVEVMVDADQNRKLPDDLDTIYNMIVDVGGRVTQKDLRKKLPYSEAKVSLMLADLEDRGFIRKIKKGRSNIIIAKD